MSTHSSTTGGTRAHREPSREIPVVEDTDVIVCGAGPAGFAAAIAAARTGARTTLLEVHGCIGGVWTAGALSWILEADRRGVMAELTDILDRRGARAGDAYDSFGYDVEAMKLALDEMVLDAGVRVQLHTRVVGAECDETGRLAVVVTESKSGRQAWSAWAVIDATGDGDVAALSGCGFEYGHPATGIAQPMSLMALLTGIRLGEIHEFVAGGAEPAGKPRLTRGERYRGAKDRLLAELVRSGTKPSYTAPSLWAIHDDLFALMANHEYGVSPMDAAQITAATINARSELHYLVAGLRQLGGVWSGVRLVATGAQIGVREGRRIHGLYTVTADDLRAGTQHPDAVCTVRSGSDVHALSADEGGYLSGATDELQDSRISRQHVAPVRRYDIPLRALIARDVDGLLLAGRCISGDFLAHSSYRLTGYAVITGQAAGATAALAALSNRLPQELAWNEVDSAITTATSYQPGDARAI